MELTAAHWVYAAVTIAIIVTMILRRGVVLPTIVGTLLVAWVYKGSVVDAFQAVFNANLVAAKELFNIFLIITLMVGLLNSLRALGADKKMIAPIQKVIKNAHVAILVIFVTTYVISLFFWPTPAVPLICALLVPAAIRAGLPAMSAAMIIAIAGQGMALSSDYIIQVAPMLTAKAAGIETAAIADKAMILSLITGGVAMVVAYAMIRKTLRKPNSEESQAELIALQGGSEPSANEEVAAALEESTITSAAREKWGSFFAAFVPLSMLAVMVYMFYSKLASNASGSFDGGNGAAFIGGVAAVLLILATIAYRRINALEKVSDHITEGFVFAFKAMGPVIPIAGFFFLGGQDFVGSILSISEEAAKPAFFVDLVTAAQSMIPQSSFLTAFGILIVGIITGLEGSGFSGLPLVGALAGSMAPGVGMDPGTLAAIGQMGSVWTGGGTIIAWSSLVAVAGFCQVSVLDLARKNLIPVLSGLTVATIVALILW